MNSIITTDRRRHPRENTLESLDRDIRLMRESLAICVDNLIVHTRGTTLTDELFNRHEIEYLNKRIPELVALREGLKGEKNVLR